MPATNPSTPALSRAHPGTRRVRPPIVAGYACRDGVVGVVVPSSCAMRSERVEGWK